MEYITQGQCQYFVVRKKRLCRMTVRPGRQYCGEHEPQPPESECQDDRRIPCPNDPKHTVYVSKLEKHLSICNARARDQPPYIVPNINAPNEGELCVRLPLAQLPRETIMQVIDKINYLYDKHVEGNITTFPEHPIHNTIVKEFSESDRTESSRRHLRQVSALLHLAEEEGLVGAGTCYVELGAGKGDNVS
ncbi:tRNA:m(4)X modification enzyme TRM13 homolog [Spodoptera litura]|uniref:tRNA:m(4)X modification enzyme TRM13 n=1 Tax=Spodoptera litura TaxID=69820 RepID=A0A9J7EA67_SPOLT|nr:tRNA:m(4)X modification enzyme TRM13 homolog [Spodoptera litura]